MFFSKIFFAVYTSVLFLSSVRGGYGMRKFLRWLFMMSGFLVVLLPILFLSPFLWFISTIGLWYFSRKKSDKSFKKYAKIGIAFSAGLFILTGCSDSEPNIADVDDIEVSVVNDNVPHFSDEDLTSTETYHENGSFDSRGRVTAANALLGVEIMPAEQRGDIGNMEPTGWNQASYANIGSGGWLYNRSHLIGHQLTGNDEYENLMTGTRAFNMQMLEYENFVANYIETTENHVRYRVTPKFEGKNLLASGLYMEAFSIEDNGEDVMFNVYVPNVQPGVGINYADGSSIGPEGPAEDGEISPYNPGSESTAGDISSVDTNGNGTVTITEAEAAGYSMPITSEHWLYPYMTDQDNDGVVGE